jgi:SAM-dependent methyltransferase
MTKQRELLTFFQRHAYELIFTIPWKQLDITRVSLFRHEESTPSPGLGSLLVNVLYSPIELVNIVCFYAGRRPVLNFSSRPGFYMNRLAVRNPESHALITLFSECEPVKRSHFHALFGDSGLKLLHESGLLEVDGDMLVPLARVHVFNDCLFVEPRGNRSILDASYKLAHAVMRNLPRIRRRRRMLDVGTGTGFHSVLFARDFDEVVALDIDEDALANTAQNVAINGTDNVMGLQSDMYANVTGQFDLIMANPPPLFLPDGYRDNSGQGQFYDGGDFGIELARRIMDGFEAHLAEDGMAAIGLISSVVDGRDLVLDYIASTFDMRRYRIEAQVVSDVIESEFVAFYDAHKITSRPRMIITFRKGQGGGLHVRGLPPLKRMLFWCQRRLSRMLRVGGGSRDPQH